jgi:D-glycero-D-manno-heptose 1,7-bisphosphate phosphatase
VVNRKPPLGQYITRCEDFLVLPQVPEAIAALNRSGRRVILATNQRGIALGLYSHEELDRMHEQLRSQLAARGARIDAIYVCPHDAGQCACRKPLTGLFEQAFRDFPSATPERSLMAGDSLRDIEAGLRAGMTTVLITGEGDCPVDEERAFALAHLAVPSLSEMVARYLCRGGEGYRRPTDLAF